MVRVPGTHASPSFGHPSLIYNKKKHPTKPCIMAILVLNMCNANSVAELFLENASLANKNYQKKSK
jgi:hypothetical protein